MPSLAINLLVGHQKLDSCTCDSPRLMRGAQGMRHDISRHLIRNRPCCTVDFGSQRSFEEGRCKVEATGASSHGPRNTSPVAATSTRGRGKKRYCRFARHESVQQHGDAAQPLTMPVKMRGPDAVLCAGADARAQRPKLQMWWKQNRKRLACMLAERFEGSGCRGLHASGRYAVRCRMCLALHS